MNTRIISDTGSACVYNKEKLKAIKVEIKRKNLWDSDDFEDLKIHVRNDNVNAFTKPLMKQILVVLEKQNTDLLQDGKEKTEEKKCVVSRAYEMRGDNEENQHYMRSFRGYNFFEKDNLYHENYAPINKLNKRNHLEENKSTSSRNQEDSFKRNSYPISREIYSSKLRSSFRSNFYISGRFSKPSKRKSSYRGSNITNEGRKRQRTCFSRSFSSP